MSVEFLKKDGNDDENIQNQSIDETVFPDDSEYSPSTSLHSRPRGDWGVADRNSNLARTRVPVTSASNCKAWSRYREDQTELIVVPMSGGVRH